MPLPALAGVALSHSLSGLEFGVAIPASLGGAVRMNAGAHRGSMDQVLEQVELYSLAQAGRAVLSSEDAGFDYRRSALPEASIVVAATVHLHAAEPPDIRGEMEKARAWRRATQPLAEPNWGSVSETHSNFIVARSGATAADVHQLIRLIQDRVAERFGVALETEVQLIGDFDLAAL